MQAEFNIFTDFNQFIVVDSTADFGDLYEKWTDETVESMFVQGDRYIAVGTMRNLYAPVLIRFESDRPVPAGSIGKTAHGVLNVPSGILEVSGPTITDSAAEHCRCLPARTLCPWTTSTLDRSMPTE